LQIVAINSGIGKTQEETFSRQKTCSIGYTLYDGTYFVEFKNRPDKYYVLVRVGGYSLGGWQDTLEPIE
jgi:hypothetical protein